MIDSTLNNYQELAMRTAYYPREVSGDVSNLIYPALKLNGEAGEVAEKIGKLLRDKGGELDQESVRLLVLELGDVLWYVAALATELGVTLEDIASANISKLMSRKERRMLEGSGDDR